MFLEIVKVFFITLFFSLGVQTLFFLRYQLDRRKIIQDHKVVFAYKSGVVGDGMLIPLTNVFAWIVLGQLTPWQTGLNFFLSMAVSGLLITFLFHWAQQRFHLTNWTMPISGHWTLLGIYHAIFMFCEISFLSFVLFNYLISIFDGTRSGGAPLSYALIILFLFFVTFVHDYWQALFSRLIDKD